MFQNVDAYGHVDTPPLENVMTAGAIGTTAAGTIAPNANAGATSTVTAVNASDNSGQFTLNAVGTPAAGVVAAVTFAQSFRKAPKKVIVTVIDITTPANPAAVAAYATGITAAGFTVTSAVLTTAHNYLVAYDVSL